ncbi:hypothetical protein [Natronorubrum bangense]|uniref:Uncharacterized protein n=2 Tax=Natronorubrum bangense TaxID=61858 RepID=L9WKY0_9EURY|nr:hypothetical protein [Natronorubrum bangense]ELY49886.1 hypothetical protein C494_07745 [Natronorubrum bangense JCM 10635]QCC55505.1 hypothetical protein DV706_14120 [Natronorubrum bangense]
MDVDEDVIRQLLQNTARTEERTKAIQRELDRMKTRSVQENARRDKRLSELEARVDRNSVILSGGLFTVGSAIVALFAKMSDLLRF